MNTLELIEPETRALNGKNIIRFPYGLLGFERVKNYVLLSRRHEEPFSWLQMLDEARHAFLVVSPFLVLGEYEPRITEEDVKFLELTVPTDALLVNIVTLRGNGRATINLKGPVVINRLTMVGKQIIPDNATQYSLNHPLPVT
ncbi:MAG TPA: flagellar assembly protein FliW [Candidatus Baltobacteraceae bacterium]|jgi:flagellar assembly factor FliW|nr:flagellar assembly protein FliW [Candidatus Baltobacteraceae bacterium]